MMNGSLFDLRFTNGMHIWPIFRYTVLIKKSTENIDIVKKRMSKATMCGSLLYGLVRLKISKKPIVFVTTTLLNMKNEIKNEYYNILDGYYFDVFPKDSVIYEYPADYQWRLPQKNKRTFTTLYYIELLSALIAKFFPSHFNADLKKYNQYFPDLSLDFLAYYNKFVQIYSFFIRIFFKYTHPKLLMVNCGCYGLTFAIMIKVANDLGIKTVEIQHGIPSKVAYKLDINYPEGNMFVKYYPNYIFTFGEYWNKEFTLPVTCYSMGHPHLNKYMKDLCPIKNKSILFISQPGQFDRLLALCLDLRKISNINIGLRLHPAEKISSEIAIVLQENAIMLSDSHIDLYTDFGRYEYVCGVYSTCLYEAIAFNMKIFLLNSDKTRLYIDTRIGVVINSAKEIIDNIDSYTNNIRSDCFWDPDFELNYKKFVNENLFN